ncbi:hypothetical protein F5887DRAFT_1074965 [Amanita rubescens]|nr:hypothetical protein F5887DRAFT_1074965 [Amanita rubescens]
MPKERVTEHSTSILGFADAQVQTPSLSGEIGEERRVYNSVVNIHARSEAISSPDNVLATHTLPRHLPISSPIVITCDAPKPSPSAVPVKHDCTQVTVSLLNANWPFGKTPSSPSLGKSEQLTRAVKPLGSPSRLPENILDLPEASAAFTLPIPIPITSPIHPGLLQHSSLEEICLQATQEVILSLNTKEPPKGSSHIGIKPPSRAVSTPFPKRRDVEKQSIGRTEISLTKGTSAATKHLTASKTASSLSKPSPVIVSSTRATPTHPSNDRASSPFPAVSKQRTLSVISTNHVVDINTTHRLSETPSRVSNGSLSPLSGENSSSPVAGEATLTHIEDHPSPPESMSVPLSTLLNIKDSLAHESRPSPSQMKLGRNGGSTKQK